jgi:hypothetical protein
MPMPEPHDPVGFWESVKDKAWDQLWPPDDEQDAWDLAAEWRGVAQSMTATADALEAQAQQSETVWLDTAGAQFAYVLRQLPDNFRMIGENLNALADGIDDYGNQIREARINILIELAVNIALFAALSVIPGGGFLAQGLARAVAGRITSMLAGMIGRTLSGGLVRALEMGVGLGIEMGKEAIDEAVIDSLTQLTSIAMGTRDQFDPAQTAKAAVTGAVGGVLGEGLGKVTGRVTAATQRGLDVVLPTPLARNLAAGIGSAGNNALTSPAAGYIVENYNNLDALTNLNGYVDAVSKYGLSSGLVGAPRSMVIDAVQQMNPGGADLVNAWADRFAGNQPPVPAGDLAPGGGGAPGGGNGTPSTPPSPPTGDPGASQTGGDTGQTGGPGDGSQSGNTDTGGTQTGNNGADTGGIQTGGTTDTGGTQTGGTGADTGGTQSGGTGADAGGTQTGATGTDTGGTQTGGTTDTGGTQTGGTGADTGGSQSGSTTDTGTTQQSGTQTDTAGTQSSDTGATTDAQSGNAGTDTTQTDTSAPQSGDTGTTQTPGTDTPGSETSTGGDTSVSQGPGTQQSGPVTTTQPIVGAQPTGTAAAAPVHTTTTSPTQATTSPVNNATPTNSAQTSNTPTHTTSSTQAPSEATSKPATRGDDTPAAESTKDETPAAPVVTSSGALVAAAAATAPVEPTTDTPKSQPTRTRVGPEGPLRGHEPQPDQTPMPPLQSRPHSIGKFAENRLTRDESGRITEIDGIPVEQKLRSLAETRVEQYWNAQRYDDETRFEGPNAQQRPAAPFETRPRQQPDVALNYDGAHTQPRNMTGNLLALALDVTTGEVFEAVNGTPEETINQDLQARLDALRKPNGYQKFDATGNPIEGERQDLPYEADPLSHAEVRAVNLGLNSRPDANFGEFITDVQFLRGQGVKPAWCCPNCSALMPDVPTNAGHRTYDPTGYRYIPGHFGDDPQTPLRRPTDPPPRLRGTPPTPPPNPNGPNNANPPNSPPQKPPTQSKPPAPTTPPKPNTPTPPVQPGLNTPNQATPPNQPPPNPPNTPNQPGPANPPVQPAPGPTTQNPTQPTTSTPPVQPAPTPQNTSQPTQATTQSTPPGPRSRVHSVAAVPHSKFGVRAAAAAKFLEVRLAAQRAMRVIGRDVGVRITDLGWGRYEVTPRNGTPFEVKVNAAQIDNIDNIAEVVVGGKGVEITVSAQLDLDQVERAVASAVARAVALVQGTQATTNVLDANSHPGSNVEPSAADHGRQAEVRNLDRQKRELARYRVLRRQRIAREMRALVEHLGVHPDDELGPQRRAVTDIEGVVDQHVRPGDRRPFWAKAPDGYPRWKAFLLLHLPAEIAPGLAAGGVIALTGAPIVGAAVAAASIATGVSGTLIKHWYGRRDKTNVDGGHGVAGKIRAIEAGQRRAAMLDGLLERARAAGILGPTPAGPGPADPVLDTEYPARVQSYPARLVARGGPAIIGASAATLLSLAGLPFWNVVSHWGVAAVAATVGPIVERYFRKSLVEREWALLDDVGRQKDQVAADFDEMFVAQLAALIDRIAGIVSSEPAPTSPDVKPADINKTGTHRYAANLWAGQAGDLARAGSDAASKITSPPQQPGNPNGQVTQATVNAAIDSVLTGGLRAVLGTIINAFIDRQYLANEYNEILAQVHHDFGNKMAEQVALEQRILTQMLDDLTAQVDAVEAAAGRVNATLASRVADIRAATPPAPTPVDPALRPRGHQRWQAVLRLHATQAAVMEGLMVGAAAAFNQGTTGIIVIGAVAATLTSSFGLRYLFRRSEQRAVDETIFADRAKERPVEQAEADARRNFLTEFWSRRIIAAAAGQALPSNPPPAPAVPPTLDFTDTAFPDHIDALVAHERELMFHEPRPWSLTGPRLVGLDRLTRLAQRVRDFTAHWNTTGNARPLRQAQHDLHRLWQAYQELKDNGTPMPTDHELLAREKPEGLRGGPMPTMAPGELQEYFDDSVVTPAGRAYYAPGDELRAEATDVPPEPGQYTIDMHGGPDFVSIGDVRLTAADLAALVMADPNWRGEPIRLLACETGQRPDGFAQQLADLLGVPVHAPSDYVGLTSDGLFVAVTELDEDGIARPVMPPTGRFHTFTPTQADEPAHTSTHRNQWWPDEDDVTFRPMRDLAPVEELGVLTLMLDGPAVYAGADRLWPDELADAVTQSGDWEAGTTRLQIRDGYVDAQFVQRFADLLGVPVHVTADTVAGDFPALSSGTLEVYNEPPGTQPGDWVVYEPRTEGDR